MRGSLAQQGLKKLGELQRPRRKAEGQDPQRI